MGNTYALMKRKEALVSVAYIREILNYCPETGILTWKKRVANRVRIGDVAGYSDGKKITFGIKGKLYLAHRVAWVLVHGEWPEQDIDHINGNPLDNRLENLRSVPHTANMFNRKKYANNTSGFKGVVFHKGSQKWTASITANNKAKFLGNFDRKEDAAKAYELAAMEIFGEFRRAA